MKASHLTRAFLMFWLAGCGPDQAVDRTTLVNGGQQPAPISPELGNSLGGNGAAPSVTPGSGGAAGQASGAGGSAAGGDQGGAGEGAGGNPATALDSGAPATEPDSAGVVPPPDAAVMVDAGTPPIMVDAAPPPAERPIDLAPPPDLQPPMTAATVAFVVGSGENPAPGDRRLMARMQVRGLRVRLVDHTRPADALTDAQLVLISASCASVNIAATFRSTALPVVSLEAFVFDDMNLTGIEKSIDFDEDQGTAVNMVNDGHELAGGLRGMRLVALSSASMAWGRPSAAAIKIAALTSSPNKAALFAYDRGAPMAGLIAPARRVGFFATEVLSETLTEDGLALFDAAIAWALR